ncbi:MAG: hypothetical protein K9L76_00570 [Candidatus Omnitrophica bacterium]|nr:hypothetical protein [Candidatus Omnitrophota bacterium]MCF7887749.1 hypothetical protein [Candidatus Omnitrophota bacterium]
MKDKRCLNCFQKKNCSNSFVSWIFFIIGLIATVAIRVVTVLMNINPLYGKIAWYVGVGGFLLFFIYKFNANRRLSNLIDGENLIEKTRGQKPLSAQEYNLIAGILCSLQSEKERINYFFIFVVSAVALFLAVYFDFIK